MWDKITVGKYQELYDIMIDENFEYDIERQTHLLSCLFGKSVEYYTGMRITDLQKEVKKIAFLSTGEIPQVQPSRYLKGKDGRKYKVVYDFRQLAAGQFIDTNAIAKDPAGLVPNMHRMLAAFCLPTRQRVFGRRKVLKYGDIPFEEVAEAMKGIPILAANATALFFYQVWEAYLKSMPGFLASKIPTMERERAKAWTQVLEAVGAGSSVPRK